jgi:hypothetical protein
MMALQGLGGCASMRWRNEPGGYLREILTAKVYDVAVRRPCATQCIPLIFLCILQLEQAWEGQLMDTFASFFWV